MCLETPSFRICPLCIYYMGLSINYVGILGAIFDTPLPHVGISTLICLTPLF